MTIVFLGVRQGSMDLGRRSSSDGGVLLLGGEVGGDKVQGVAGKNQAYC